MDPPSEADGFVSIICETREVPASVGLAPQPERRQRTVTDHDPADTRCGRHLDLPRRSRWRRSIWVRPTRSAWAGRCPSRHGAQVEGPSERGWASGSGRAEVVGRAGNRASSRIQRIKAPVPTGEGAKAPLSGARRRPPWGSGGPPMSPDASGSGRRPEVGLPKKSRESLKNPFAFAMGSVTHRAPFGTADGKTQRPSTLLCPSTAAYAPLPPPAVSAMS